MLSSSSVYPLVALWCNKHLATSLFVLFHTTSVCSYNVSPELYGCGHVLLSQADQQPVIFYYMALLISQQMFALVTN